MISLMALLKVWRPGTIYRFEDEPAVEEEFRRRSPAQVARAWLPYIALTVMVLLWGLPAVKTALNRTTVLIPVAGLDGAIARVPPGQARAAAVGMPAKFKFDWLASGGTAVLIAAVFSASCCGVGARGALRAMGGTLRDMRYPAATIASILALAYVMNDSGMTTSLGILCTRSGRAFPFLSPFLGWVGVFLTGSDTSSNVLFGGLQKAAAERLGLNPILTAAANTSGGVMGKMISPQSLAVACAATGLVGQEGSLFRSTLKHSLLLLALVGIIVYLQAFWFPWMIPS
jgi:lactate permease